MSELTSLTLSEARTRLAKKEFSAVELAQAHVAAIDHAELVDVLGRYGRLRAE